MGSTRRERSLGDKTHVWAYQKSHVTPSPTMEALGKALDELDAQKAERQTVCARFLAVERHLSNKTPGQRLHRLALPSKLFPVTLGNSSVHGQGVFATRDIAKGELLTLYPPDAFILVGEDRTHVTRSADQLGGHDRLLHLIRFYSQTLEGNVRVLGDPRAASDPAYLGHMINCAVGRPGQGRLSYKIQKALWNRHNAKPVQLLTKVQWAFVAVRSIRQGDEILTFYGSGYWASFEELNGA